MISSRGAIINTETAKRYERKAHKAAQGYAQRYTAAQVATIIWNRFGFLSVVEGDKVTFKTQFGICGSYDCQPEN